VPIDAGDPLGLEAQREEKKARHRLRPDTTLVIDQMMEPPT
jgi:hypothetical protein